MSGNPYDYPIWVPGSASESQPGRSDINETAADPRTLAVAAEGSPIGVIYGRAAVSPMIFAVGQSDFEAKMSLGMAWCMGEIDEVEAIYQGDTLINPNYVTAHYEGTTTQHQDPLLSGSIPFYYDRLIGTAMGVDYGIAYSALYVPITSDFSFNISGVIRGTRVRDPRTGSISYSNNSALCLAHFLESPLVGLGLPVNDDSLIEAANYCDQLLADGSKRCTTNISFLSQYSVSSVIETLRAYANCWVYKDGGELILVPQEPRASSGTITDSDIRADQINIEQITAADQPTVVTVEYTDTAAWPWVTRKETVMNAGLASGSVAWRESRISMLGLHNRASANRFAVQRLNYATLVNLRAEVATFDESLSITVGDVVEVTHSWGLTEKEMRVIGVDATGPGRWMLRMEEYDASVYSDAIEEDIARPDTNLPLPSEVPAVTGLTLTEVLFQTDKGFWLSRISVSWDPLSDNYIFNHDFIVTIEQLPGEGSPDRSTIAEIVSSGYEVSSPPVQEHFAYFVSVTARSQWGNVVFYGEPATGDVLARGKYLPPGDVPEIRAIEAGGNVYINWDPAVDIDIWRYELRYGSVGVAWEDAVLLERIDASRLTTGDMPSGTWDILVKAIDSVGNESATAARTTVTVTIDETSTSGATYSYTSVSATTNMTETIVATGRCWVTNDGASWDSVFPNELDTYQDIVATYSASGGSNWTSEEFFWSQPISGDWRMPEFNATIIGGGTPIKEMQLRDPLAVWHPFPALSGRGSYDTSRAYAEGLSGEILKVAIPTIRVEVSSAPRTQSGEATFDGVSPTTIALNYAVNAITSIQVTPTTTGGVFLVGVVDNVIVGDNSSFDVYLFDSDGAMVAGSFFWEFRGI